MFSRGGMAVLDAIESMGYDTLNRRPEVSKGKQVRLLGRAIVAHVLGETPTPITRSTTSERRRRDASGRYVGRARIVRRMPPHCPRGAQQLLPGIFSAAKAEARWNCGALCVHAT